MPEMNKSHIIPSDFSKMEETQCYCSPQSAAAIREQISRIPLKAIHFIGTGDYHYVSLFYLERIDEDFLLVLYDNHPDNQESAFGGGCISCGGWVKNASSLPHCKGVLWNALPEESDGGLPVYLSVDLDVLSTEFAHTDWNQGEMTLEFLKKEIKTLCERCRIIGADICGGITPSKGGTIADSLLNQETTEAVAGEIRLSEEQRCRQSPSRHAS